MNDPASPASPAPPRPGLVPNWLEVILIVATALQLMEGLSGIAGLFAETGDTSPAGANDVALVAMVAIKFALAAIALAALIRKRFRGAILAMAAMIAAAWLGDMPSVVRHGLDLRGSLVVNAEMIFRVFICPVLAVMAAILALKNERIALAGILVCVPVAMSIIGVIAFAIGVMIYGF